MANFYEASIAGVRLWISSLDTEGPRATVEHQGVTGDDVEIKDRGRGPHRTRCELLFATMPGETSSPLERLNAFRALVEAKQPDEGYYFTHPIEGTYRVAIGDFSYSVTGGILRASATFTRKGTVSAITPIGPAVSPEAGLEAVSSAAEAATRELADVGLTSDVPAASTAAATRWAAAESSAREVFLEVASLSQRIQDEIGALDLTGDLQLWGAYKSLVTLQEAVASAADAATSEVSSVFAMLIDRPTPLRAIVARIYGSMLSEERLAQVVKLNDVRTPARIPQGTTLIMPTLPPAPRGA